MSEEIENEQVEELTEEAEQQSWQITATAAELLAFSLRYPTPELIDAIVSGEWLEAAKEIAAASGWVLPDDFASEPMTADAQGEQADADRLLHVIRAEATRLYVGAPQPVCSPYEGIWRAEDDGVQGLLFVNPHSMAVERYLKGCGLGQPEGTNEPLDHAATELEFLQYLAALSAGAPAPENAVPADKLPAGSPQAAYDEFMEEHVQTWMPRFAAKTIAETRLPFYRAVGQLLACFLGA